LEKKFKYLPELVGFSRDQIWWYCSRWSR